LHRRITLFLAILLATLISGCGSRRAEVSRTRLGVIEKAAWSRNAPADRVYITAPREEPVRPEAPGQVSQIAIRDTVLRKEGENGAVMSVRLRGREFLDADCYCPPVKETGKTSTEVDLKQKDKEVERDGVSFGAVLAIAMVAFAVGLVVGTKVKSPG